MRSCRFNVEDTTLHPDSIHRGGGQIIPTTRRVLYAAQLVSEPKLQEPFFLCEVTCPNDVSGSVYGCLTQKRGEIDEEIQVPGTPLTTIKAFLPVAESFGFTGYLRANTSGKAFPSCSFHHWAQLPGNPMDLVNENNAVKIIKETRQRKGLKADFPKVSDYEDKL